MTPFLRQVFLLLVFWALGSAAVFIWHPDARPLLGGGGAAVPVGEGEISLAAALLAASERDVLWIDTRPEAEFRRETIPNAVNIPEEAHSDLEIKLFELTNSGRLRPDTTVVIFCASTACRSGHQMRNGLLAMNPDMQVLVLAGGWPEWKRGQAVARDSLEIEEDEAPADGQAEPSV